MKTQSVGELIAGKVYGEQEKTLERETPTPLGQLNAETGLAPCPFCGRTNNVSPHQNAKWEHRVEGWWTVKCNLCCVTIDDSPTIEEARAHWNRRAPITDRGLQDFLHKLGQDLLEIENHCPCGARPESPNSHPHVGGCPVERAIRRSLDFSLGRGALIASRPQTPAVTPEETKISEETALKKIEAIGRQITDSINKFREVAAAGRETKTDEELAKEAMVKIEKSIFNWNGANLTDNTLSAIEDHVLAALREKTAKEKSL